MILLAGARIKYRGSNEEAVLAEIEQSLRGHCVRRKSAIVITKTIKTRLKMYPNGASESRISNFDPLIDLNTHRSNGE